MKNKELVTELAARMGWTAQEVAETLSVPSSFRCLNPERLSRIN